jgi:hypothetical protein
VRPSHSICALSQGFQEKDTNKKIIETMGLMLEMLKKELKELRHKFNKASKMSDITFEN